MLKKILAIVCCVAICLSLVACGTGFGSLKFKGIDDSYKPSDALIAQNEKYTLELDKTNMGLVLTENSTGEQWSTTPIDASGEQVDEFGMPIKKHPRVESILAVECKEFAEDEFNTYYSYTDAVKGGQVSYKPIENGIILFFFFDEAQVMIPLECVLTNDGLKLSVNPKQIRENENKVVGISIAPFFCGVKNDSENSYLFVPSGSGALVGTTTKSEQGDTFSAQVYGYDPAIDEVASTSTKEPVRLNVYGSKNGNKAMCAIVDGSAGSAWVNVTSGSKTLGYSSCYTTFQMRGYTNHVAQLFSYEKVENMVYSKKMITRPISVTFCPISGENADYSGMANVYRDYLIKHKDMNDSCKDVPLNIRVLGGSEITKSFVGIPYKTVYPATTLKAAQDIMDEIQKELDTEFAVQLKGFGQNGLDAGKIAGNYSVNKNLGKLSQLEKMFEEADDNGIDLYFDFDIERFSKNSFGVSKFFDSATNAGEQKVLQYHYDVAVRDRKQDTSYHLLSPEHFLKVFDNVLKTANKHSFSGISLDTLSSVCYSDYIDKDNAEYYSKNGFATAAERVIQSARKNKKRFMASNANLYAAFKADIISESPVSSEKSHIFLYDVPFYQMVFKGSVPITVQSVNLAADTKQMILKAIESGSGLSYTVIDCWDSSVIDANSPYFYNSVFEDIKDDIFENSKQLSDYYKKISGKHIIKHTVFENGLRETVFENGVCVYVNYTQETLSTPAGELSSYEYLITEK